MERIGNGMEMEINYKLSMELMWNRMDCSVEFQGEGNGDKFIFEMGSEWNGMELEWKWNGTFMKKFGDKKRNRNREEMERKWNGKFMKNFIDAK